MTDATHQWPGDDYIDPPQRPPRIYAVDPDGLPRRWYVSARERAERADSLSREQWLTAARAWWATHGSLAGGAA